MAKNGKRDDEPLVIIPVDLRMNEQEQRYTILNGPNDSIRWWFMPFHIWAELVNLNYGLVRIMHESEDGEPYGLKISTESIMHELVRTPEELSSDWLDASLRKLAERGPVTAMRYYDCFRKCYVVEAYRIEDSIADIQRAKDS